MSKTVKAFLCGTAVIVLTLTGIACKFIKKVVPQTTMTTPFVTDTVPLHAPWDARKNVRVVSVASQIAAVLRRIVDEGSGD